MILAVKEVAHAKHTKLRNHCRGVGSVCHKEIKRAHGEAFHHRCLVSKLRVGKYVDIDGTVSFFIHKSCEVFTGVVKRMVVCLRMSHSKAESLFRDSFRGRTFPGS